MSQTAKRSDSAEKCCTLLQMDIRKFRICTSNSILIYYNIVHNSICTSKIADSKQEIMITVVT